MPLLRSQKNDPGLTYTLVFSGMFPVGTLLSRSVAEIIGEPTTVASGALVMIALGGVLWLYVPQLRALE
jgi:hypothetical protein